MTDLDMGAQSQINWPALNEELKSALPGKLYGTSYANDVLYVHVVDGLNAEALRPQIVAVIKAHDPSVKTPEQAAEEARQTALLELQDTDLAAILTGAQSATTLEEMRPLLLDAVGLLSKLMLVAGIMPPSA